MRIGVSSDRADIFSFADDRGDERVAQNVVA